MGTAISVRVCVQQCGRRIALREALGAESRGGKKGIRVAGGRSHAAARSESQDACVSFRRVGAGRAETTDGNVCNAGRRNRLAKPWWDTTAKIAFPRQS